MPRPPLTALAARRTPQTSRPLRSDSASRRSTIPCSPSRRPDEPPTLLDHSNLTIDVVMIVEEDVRVKDPEGRGRGGRRRAALPPGCLTSTRVDDTRSRIFSLSCACLRPPQSSFPGSQDTPRKATKADGLPATRRESNQPAPDFDVDAHRVRCTVYVRPDWPVVAVLVTFANYLEDSDRAGTLPAAHRRVTAPSRG